MSLVETIITAVQIQLAVESREPVDANTKICVCIGDTLAPILARIRSALVLFPFAKHPPVMKQSIKESAISFLAFTWLSQFRVKAAVMQHYVNPEGQEHVKLR